MTEFCSLFSSSSGNCTYIGNRESGILVDVGVSAKRTEAALHDIGVDPSKIRGIFVTHEHSDHINGIKVFAGRYGINVYASLGTLEGMNELNTFNGKFEPYIIPKSGFELEGFYIRPFKTPHDSRESCGYSVLMPDGKRISIATDIGKMTDEILTSIHGSDLVLLESNHDVRMLQTGPYPYYLKKRILSDHGHLSNEICADTAVKLLESGTTHFVLGHLSKENNIPSLAYEATHSAMTIAGAAEGTDYKLSVALDNNPLITL